MLVLIGSRLTPDEQDPLKNIDPLSELDHYTTMMHKETTNSYPKRKLLVVGPSISPIVVRLVKHMRDAGHEVLLASHDAENICDVIDLGKSKSFSSIFMFWKLKRIVNKFRPDVIHAHGLSRYGLMCALQNRPFVVALWGSDVMVLPKRGIIIKQWIYKLINRLVLKRAARCHTSSPHVCEEADRQFRGTAAKTDSFYWGFPLASPTPDVAMETHTRLQSEFSLPDTGLVVFPRGLGKIYEPLRCAKIIRSLLSRTHLQRQIVVLRGFATDNEVSVLSIAH